MSLSVNLHLDSMTDHREKVVAGRTTGQFVEGDVVTWSARYFGLPLRLTIRIFDVDAAPHRFADEQVRSPFPAYHHEHLFEEIDGHTHMRDRLPLAAPYGPLGRLAEKLFLRRYMQRLLEERNAALVRSVSR